MKDMIPWYKGLTGPIQPKRGSTSFVSFGIIDKVFKTSLNASFYHIITNSFCCVYLED